MHSQDGAVLLLVGRVKQLTVSSVLICIKTCHPEEQVIPKLNRAVWGISCHLLFKISFVFTLICHIKTDFFSYKISHPSVNSSVPEQEYGLQRQLPRKRQPRLSMLVKCSQERYVKISQISLKLTFFSQYILKSWLLGLWTHSACIWEKFWGNRNVLV